MQLGILSSPIIFKPPLKSFNGHINKLVTVVDQITPPGGKCIFINEGNLPIVSIHNTHRCMYFGERSALEKFNMSLKKVGEAVPASVNLEVEMRQFDTAEEDKVNEAVPSRSWSGELDNIGARIDDEVDNLEEKLGKLQHAVVPDVQEKVIEEDDIENSVNNVKKEFNNSYGSCKSDK